MRTRFVAVVALAMAGCGPRPQPVHTDPVEVGQLARLTLPPSASNTRWQTDRDNSSWLSIPGPDHSVWGRFDIPATDLLAFLDQLPKDATIRPHSGHSNVTSRGIAEPWWQPERLRQPHVADGSKPGFSWNVMFGEAEQAGTVTVYFFNFSM